MSDNIKYPPQSQVKSAPIQKQRSSNLELYRILCMLMIVAHHYATNSGLNAPTGPVRLDPDSLNSIFLRLFGMWGKTGINCFVMITGYFMCTSRITFRKYMKLLSEVLFYNVVLYIVFLFTGYEKLSILGLVKGIMPIWGFENMFTSCFLAFYLFIPFLTFFVQKMTKMQHLLLIFLLLGCYTILGSIPAFDVRFNYITWFGVIFIIASYFRLHSSPVFQRKNLWGWLTLLTVVLAMLSVYVLQKIMGSGYLLVSDSNKFFAVAVAITSFLWFKNLNIPQSKLINTLGASTFGVLLIHANSSAMRTWLWKDTVDVVGHYTLSTGLLIIFSISVVLIVFLHVV